MSVKLCVGIGTFYTILVCSSCEILLFWHITSKIRAFFDRSVKTTGTDQVRSADFGVCYPHTFSCFPLNSQLLFSWSGTDVSTTFSSFAEFRSLRSFWDSQSHPLIFDVISCFREAYDFSGSHLDIFGSGWCPTYPT